MPVSSPPGLARRFLWIGLPALALTLALLIWHPGKAETPPAFGHATMTVTRADGSRQGFSIEMATTGAQQEYGLMFRKFMAPDHGMLFLSATDDAKTMWMKNTLIPLDMLFVTADGRIVKITQAKPLDLTPLPSGQPVRAVVELAGGATARQNIGVGDTVSYQGVAAQQSLPPPRP